MAAYHINFVLKGEMQGFCGRFGLPVAAAARFLHVVRMGGTGNKIPVGFLRIGRFVVALMAGSAGHLLVTFVQRERVAGGTSRFYEWLNCRLTDWLSGWRRFISITATAGNAGQQQENYGYLGNY